MSAMFGEGLYVARAELVLARPDHLSLSEVELSPDPLGTLAAAIARLNAAAGEQAELLLDLVAVDGRRVARRRRALLRRAGRRGPMAYGERVGSGMGVWGALEAGLSGGKRPAGGGAGRAPRLRDLSEGIGKFVPEVSGVCDVQLLLRVAARHPQQARARLQELLAVMDVWEGENWWRPVGPRWAGWRPYSNVWWLRRRFDQRADRGDFAPARRQWVTPRELGPLLKPPSVRCTAPNVLRCGGVVPAAPAELPTWTGQADVVPLGMVSGPDGQERLAGVYAKELLFGASLGKSGFGKTEQALVQFISRAYSGDGCWFLDPHRRAMERARPYLTHPAVAGRVREVDLSQPTLDTLVTCWNPLSMEGKRTEDVQSVVGAVVGGIATAQGWGDRAPRARTLLSLAIRTLAEVSHLLVRSSRPDLQPTIFQTRTLLMDDDWREELLPYLTPPVRQFWERTFPKLASDSTPTVTYAIDRLENSLSLKAFLGSPQGGYDVRRAMDDGHVMFVSPSGTGEGDSLITSLLIFDLFRAGLTRPEPKPGCTLPTLWAWVDELTSVDGASNGVIPQILEQLRKFEVRLLGATQMVMRLSPETRQALLQNQSLLSATGADWDEASFLSKRMPGVTPETVMGIDRYNYVVSAELHGRRSSPFRVRGVPVDKLYAAYYDPAGVGGLLEQVGRAPGRRSVREVLEVQERLDDDIVDFLAGRIPMSRAPGGGKAALSPVLAGAVSMRKVD